MVNYARASSLMNIKYKIIASVLFFQTNFLFAENNFEKNTSLTVEEVSIYSEKVLIDALDFVKNGNVDEAIEKLEKLIELNPSFNAAQLIYADLMLSRSQPITDFGNITNAPYTRINSLLSEVKARWNFHKATIDNNKIPSSLIKLANSQSHVIVVDALTSRLFLFENNNGVPKLKSDFYVTIGKNGTGKYVEGDQKTPIGVYFVTGFIPSEDLPDLYGDGAFPINYPNAWDRSHNRTGYGIWLHGTPSKFYSRAPKDSDGCVIVSNNDLNTLSRFIDVGETPIVIVDNINWITKDEWEKRNTSYNLFVEQWRQDWESRNVGSYLSHYSKDYTGLGKNYDSWVEYKSRIIPTKKFIKVDLSNKSVFVYPEPINLMVVTFMQDYSSDTFRKKFLKRQYWKMEQDGKWRIIFEGAAS